MKRIISIIIAICFAINVSGQDADFSVQIQTFKPLTGIIPVGDTAIYQLTIENNGNSSLMQYSVRATLTAPSNGQIVGIAPGTDMGVWSVSSISSKASGNSIILVNTGGEIGTLDGWLNGGTINSFNINVLIKGVIPEGVAEADVLDKPKVFGANVGFNVLSLSVPNDKKVQPSTYNAQGNTLISNDNQQTSLTVSKGTGAPPLPVKLISFTAQYESSVVETNWAIENELSFSHYEVERSKDGIIFSSIGSIAAANNKNYSYADNLSNFNSSLVYYRLKMVDKDGKVTYSSIRKLSLEKEKEVSIKIYPNPVLKESALNVELGGLDAGTHTISMIAINGVVVKARTFKVPSTGSTTLVIITSNIPSGTYTVVIKGPTHQYTRTVVVAGR